MLAPIAMNVLVIEDEKLMNWSLSKSLGRWGFEVHPVFNGQDAFRELEKSSFDIILVDYQLPDLDGLEVARQVRRMQPGAVIVLVTAFQLGELNINSGLVDAYFNKPVDMKLLRQTLQRFAGKQDAGNAH